MKKLGILVIGILAATLATACDDGASGGGDGGGDGGGGPGGPGSIMGQLQGLDGGVPDGATITVDGEPVELNEQGWFFLTDVAPGERIRVDVTAPGHVPVQKFVTIRPARQPYLDAKMFARSAPVDVDAATGGDVLADNGNAVVTLPANAFRKAGAAFAGNARVSLTVLDPSERESRLAIPGDLPGVPQDGGDPTRIASFGMIDLAAEDDEGNALELDPAAGTIVKIPIPAALVGAPPATIPLWRYDLAEGRWIEVGTATYNEASTCYDAPVDQPAQWNADQPYATACVTGRVVTPDGDPAIGGITVASEGISYIGEAMTATEEGGTFRVEVMASTDGAPASARLWAQGGGFYTTPEQAIVVDPTPTQLSADGCTDVGTITLAYPLARTILTWGESPSDLDSHFTGPDDAGGRFHMYYGNSDIPGIANLDTDDTSSYGPEVTSLLDDRPGTYVYAIHNYSGEGAGPIQQSGAKVTAFFPDEVRTFSVSEATGSATGNGVWRVFRFTIADDGSVGGLEPLNELVEAGDESVYEP